MAHELIAAFERASEDDEVGAVIVTGEGRAFCAGMDLSSEGNVFGLDETQSPTLSDMVDRLEDPVIRDGVRDTGGRVTLAIYNCKKPVIAAINGAAVGIGATMTLAMDFRLASEKARMGFVFGKLGIVPEACSSWFLPRLVGPQQALEWVLSADIFDAAEGLRGGLFRSVHAPENLMEDARKLAHKFIDGRSPVAVALARQMLIRNAAQNHPIEAHRIDSLAMFHASIGDGKEGVAAFLEKREPVFEGKASDMPFWPWSQ
jgi:enoyl-CoA hydratase/carnithine racemase